METIKLDYDIKRITEVYNLFAFRGKWIIKFFKLNIVGLNIYSTKKGYHIYIKVKNRLSNQDMVFIQLALGSDYMRECYYWKRIRFPVLPRKEWNILFIRKRYTQKRKVKDSVEVFEKFKTIRLAQILELTRGK